ncbi:MAG: hypothetical protein AAF711_00210 [Planctomycetota bacterium]
MVSQLATVFATLIASIVVLPAEAQLKDDLTDTTNFATPFGPLQMTSAAKHGGTVTLTRTAVSEDAGVDWMIDGKRDLPLTEDTDTLRLTPHAAIDDGYYVASILFFDRSGNYLAEAVWIEDTNALTPRLLDSVTRFAADQGVEGAARYRLRLRINPIDRSDAGFVFDQIMASAPPAPPHADTD